MASTGPNAPARPDRSAAFFPLLLGQRLLGLLLLGPRLLWQRLE